MSLLATGTVLGQQQNPEYFSKAGQHGSLVAWLVGNGQARTYSANFDLFIDTDAGWTFKSLEYEVWIADTVSPPANPNWAKAGTVSVTNAGLITDMGDKDPKTQWKRFHYTNTSSCGTNKWIELRAVKFRVQKAGVVGTTEEIALPKVGPCGVAGTNPGGE